MYAMYATSDTYNVYVFVLLSTNLFWKMSAWNTHTQETITAGNWARKKSNDFNYTNLYKPPHIYIYYCDGHWAHECLLRHFLIAIDNVCQQRVHVLIALYVLLLCMWIVLCAAAQRFFCCCCSRLCKWVGSCGDRSYLPIWIYILWQSENEQWTK